MAALTQTHAAQKHLPPNEILSPWFVLFLFVGTVSVAYKADIIIVTSNKAYGNSSSPQDYFV